MDESMVFYSSFYEALDGFNDEDKLEMLKAIIEYGLYGTLPELYGASWSIFRLVKPQIDANVERRENGKKGGRKKTPVSKSKTNGSNGSENQKPMVSTLKTYGSENENHRLEKTKPNVNVNVNANANVLHHHRASAREEHDEDYEHQGWNPDELITTTAGTQIRLGDVHFGETVKLRRKQSDG